jgi:hypothetical protein
MGLSWRAWGLLFALAAAALSVACASKQITALELTQLQPEQFCGTFLAANFARLPPDHRMTDDKVTLWVTPKDNLLPGWTVLDFASQSGINCGNSSTPFGYNACDPPTPDQQQGFCLSVLPTCMNPTGEVSGFTPDPRITEFPPSSTLLAKIAVFRCTADGVCSQTVGPLTWNQGCRKNDAFLAATPPPAVTAAADTVQFKLAAVRGDVDFGPGAPQGTRGEITADSPQKVRLVSDVPILALARRPLIPDGRNNATFAGSRIPWDEDFSSHVRVSRVRVFDGEQSTTQVKFCKVSVPNVQNVPDTPMTCNGNDCSAELLELISSGGDVTPAYNYSPDGSFLLPIDWKIVFGDSSSACPSPDPGTNLYIEFELVARKEN